MKKVESNIEFMTRVMEWRNPLMQVFVIEAIACYASLVKKNPLREGSFISPEAWDECADRVLEEVKRRSNGDA